MFQISSGLPLYLEIWKDMEFDNLGKKNLEKPGILTIFTFSVVEF